MPPPVAANPGMITCCRPSPETLRPSPMDNTPLCTNAGLSMMDNTPLPTTDDRLAAANRQLTGTANRWPAGGCQWMAGWRRPPMDGRLMTVDRRSAGGSLTNGQLLPTDGLSFRGCRRTAGSRQQMAANGRLADERRRTMSDCNVLHSIIACLLHAFGHCIVYKFLLYLS